MAPIGASGQGEVGRVGVMAPMGKGKKSRARGASVKLEGYRECWHVIGLFRMFPPPASSACFTCLWGLLCERASKESGFSSEKWPEWAVVNVCKLELET